MALKVSNCRLIVSEGHRDNNGELFVFENLKTVPFEIKRVYSIKNVLCNTIRGKHAHSLLKQLIICLSGSCKFLLDDGKNKEIITLNTPKMGLFIGTYVWREMFDFSKDCVLMVLASEFYDANEYIRNYEDFLKIIRNDSLL